MIGVIEVICISFCVLLCSLSLQDKFMKKDIEFYLKNELVDKAFGFSIALFSLWFTSLIAGIKWIALSVALLTLTHNIASAVLLIIAKAATVKSALMLKKAWVIIRKVQKIRREKNQARIL